MNLKPQVAGPLVVIFCFAIVPAALVVPLLCYKYLPMLFGAAVSTAERVVHHVLIKRKNEAYQSQFEVGNTKEHPNKVVLRWGCLGNLWLKREFGNSSNGDDKNQTKTQRESHEYEQKIIIWGQSVVHTLCLPVTFAIHEVYFGLFHLLRTSLG